MNKQSNIPQLRFKGFDGEWLNEKLLEHVNSISSGKIKPTDEGDFLVYGSTGVIGKSNIYSHDGDYILVARGDYYITIDAPKENTPGEYDRVFTSGTIRAVQGVINEDFKLS